MAHYSIEKDLIENCQQGTLTWFHEARHQTQIKKIPTLKMFFNEFFVVVIFTTIVFSQNWLWAIIPFSVYAALELDAWLWGVIEWTKWKQQ